MEHHAGAIIPCEPEMNALVEAVLG
jgi:hypothetical protein